MTKARESGRKITKDGGKNLPLYDSKREEELCIWKFCSGSYEGPPQGRQTEELSMPEIVDS